MFDIKLNTGRNAILCKLSGRFDLDEARAYVEKFKAGIDRLQSGFIIITDISEFTPSEDESRTILRSGTEYALAKAPSRAIRIVSENVGSQVGNLQLNRTTRELGGYKVEIVHSLDEAKALLDWS